MKVLISPAHHLLDWNLQSEYYLAAKIIHGLAVADLSIEYHVICGYFANKDSLPSNVKVYELYKSSDIRLNVFALVYFYIWLLYKSTAVSLRQRFDLIWHFLPSGPYSLNLFVLFRLHRLFGIKRAMLGRLGAAYSETEKQDDYIIEVKNGQRTFTHDSFRFLLDFIYWIMGFFTEFYFQNFDTLIFYNQEGKNFYQSRLRQNLDDKRVSLIPVGFDHKQFSFKQKELKQPYRFLFVGALVDRKRPFKALDIIVELKNMGVDCRLDYFGKGYLQSELEKKVDALGLQDQVTVHGAVSKSEVSRYYQQAHFLLSMSSSEIFTHTMLESWATGTVFVASNGPENIEMMDNEKYGYILDPNKPTDIRRICEIIVELDARTFNQRTNVALQRSQDFHWEKIILEYLRLIQNPADNKHN